MKVSTLSSIFRITTSFLLQWNIEKVLTNINEIVHTYMKQVKSD